MAHFSLTPGDDGGYSTMLDGFDLTPYLLREGFSIRPESDASFPDRMRVTMTISVDKLDVDLPDALVDATFRAECSDAEQSA